MKYPLKQVMGMMPEINQKSNDRSSFLCEELHSERMAQQNTCELALNNGSPHQPTAETPGEIFMTRRLELLSHSGLRVRAFFNSALAYVYNVCITRVYYNYMYLTMPFFVFVFIIIIFP